MCDHIFHIQVYTHSALTHVLIMHTCVCTHPCTHSFVYLPKLAHIRISTLLCTCTDTRHTCTYSPIQKHLCMPELNYRWKSLEFYRSSPAQALEVHLLGSCKATESVPLSPLTTLSPLLCFSSDMFTCARFSGPQGLCPCYVGHMVSVSILLSLCLSVPLSLSVFPSLPPLLSLSQPGCPGI